MLKLYGQQPLSEKSADLFETLELMVWKLAGGFDSLVNRMAIFLFLPRIDLFEPKSWQGDARGLSILSILSLKSERVALSNLEMLESWDWDSSKPILSESTGISWSPVWNGTFVNEFRFDGDCSTQLDATVVLSLSYQDPFVWTSLVLDQLKHDLSEPPFGDFSTSGTNSTLDFMLFGRLNG